METGTNIKDKPILIIICAIFICMIVATYIGMNKEIGDKPTTLESEIETENTKTKNTEADTEIETETTEIKTELKSTTNKTEIKTESKTTTNETTKEENKETTTKASEDGGETLVNLGKFKLTAYCNCTRCCGKYANGATASGTIPKEGRTIAVDTRVIPFGTKVVINGITYIAEDTGSAIKGKKIDIFFDNHQEAKNFGVQYAEVFKIVS